MSRRSKTKAAPQRAVALNDRWLVLGVCVFLAAITWFVFGQTRTFQFINFDDNEYVFKNAQVARGLTMEGIAWAFTHVYAANWHPLTWLSHMLDAQLYGLNPGGHHLTNVVLHGATAVLLFLVLRNMTRALWRSAFVAAVFAIHPLRVESVAWVAERKDVLSGLFFVLAIGAYVRYARHPSGARYGLVMLLFALGLMCKPMLVTLPVVLLALDYWPLNRLNPTGTGTKNVPGPRKLVLEKLPLLALAAASSLATLFAQQVALQPLATVSLMVRAGNAAMSGVVYLYQAFWPSCLAALYPFAIDQVRPGKVLLALAVLAAISIAVFCFRRHRYLVTGWLWYSIMLAPVIGILQVGSQAHADRYTYLPHIGLYLLLTWAAADLIERWRAWRFVLGALSIGIVLTLAFAARTQTSYWHNSESLWRRVLACTSRNSGAEQNLGQAIYEKGNVEEAMVHFQNALRIDPSQASVHSALGVALLEMGRADQSLLSLRKALEIDPNDADAHYNIGNTLLQLGHAREAAAQYSRALEINPDDIEAQNNLAWVLATCPDAAVRNGIRAIAIAERADSLTMGKSPVIRATLAAAYAETGRFADAVKAAERAFELAAAEGNQSRASSIRAQIELYRTASAFRDRRYTPVP
ncbi:MAG TPA: tetratricopeptide repeat protein [Chthoniobacterales bacterium]|nr:tetratricopeptide repeat protein [Chthoniobacterales bacterium]